MRRLYRVWLLVVAFTIPLTLVLPTEIVLAIPQIRAGVGGDLAQVQDNDPSSSTDINSALASQGISIPSFLDYTIDLKYFLTTNHTVNSVDTTTYSFTPVPGLTDVKSLTTIRGGTWLAVKNDGTVWSWGSNASGALGRPLGSSADTANNTDPVPAQIPGLSNVVSTGGPHAYIGTDLDADGSVWTWGNDNFGQTGTNPNATLNTNGNINNIVIAPTKVTLPGQAIEVSSGSQQTMALMSNHTVQKWGVLKDDENGLTGSFNPTPVQETGISNVIDISSDIYTAYYVKSDGTVWVNGAYIGVPVSQDLSNTKDNASAIPLQVTGLANITEMDVGNNCIVARSSADDLWIEYNGTVTELSYTKGAGLFHADQDGSSFYYIVPTQVALASLSISPSPTTISRGAQQQLTVTGTYSDSSTKDVTAQATYSSSNPSVASVDGTGNVTGSGVGQATITATFSGQTTTVNVTVLPVPPQAPTNLALANGNGPGKLNLTWQAPNDDGGATITNYLVLRRTGTSGAYTQVGSVSGSVLSYNDSGLTTGTAYYYEVVAVNSAGQSAPSTSVSRQAPGILGNPVCVLGICI